MYSWTVIYLVNQIVLGALTYQEVITARPDLKTKIDAYIAEKNLTIDKTV
jgi:hypothetical protein